MGASGSDSSSKSNSINQAQSYGASISNGFNASQTYVDPQSAGQFNQMRKMAMNAADPTGAQAAAAQQSLANAGYLGGAANTLQGLADPSAQIAAQSASLQAGLGDLFQNEINPAIKSEAVLAGGLGGGRQGVAQGVAAGELADAFTQGYGDIVARANNQAMSAANSMPGLTQAMMGNSQSPYGAGLDILGQLSGVLGQQNILSKSAGANRSASQNGSQAFGRSSSNSKAQSFGFNWFS